MPEQRFAGRVAIVTGGVSGIGLGIAERLHREGAKLALWDMDAKALANHAARLNAHTEVVDTTDAAAVQRAADATAAALGGIDIVIASAGITGPNGPVWEYPLDAWRRVIDVNLNGVYYTNRAVVPHMLKTGTGRIVNIASIAAKYPLELRILSGAPRAALVNYTGAVARRVAADNVTLNTVLPGMFHTAFVHEQFTENARRNGTSYEQEVAKFTEAYQIPARRFGDPRDVGSLVAWLCSEFAGYITGQSIAVDGAATRSTF